MSTTPILRSLVSSHKADFFKCDSIDESAFITIPYACTYSHGKLFFLKLMGPLNIDPF